jgi:hypothetical protein
MLSKAPTIPHPTSGRTSLVKDFIAVPIPATCWQLCL